MTLHQSHWPRVACIAKHEMGHYVIARAMGFRTGYVSIEMIEPKGGLPRSPEPCGKAEIKLPEAIESLECLRVYLRRRVLVLYAGGVAETLPNRGSLIKKVDIARAIDIIRNPGHGCEQDHAKARELLQLLRNASYPDTDLSDENALQANLDTLNENLFTRAVELVEEMADTIIGLGGNLADRVNKSDDGARLQADYLEGLPSVQNIVKRNP